MGVGSSHLLHRLGSAAGAEFPSLSGSNRESKWIKANSRG
ncbi:hypothetical protein OROHE_016427 [Orobanche hederae]